MDTVEDYYFKRAALVKYLTHDWMRFTQNQVDRENKNQSKARTLPIWEQVGKEIQALDQFIDYFMDGIRSYGVGIGTECSKGRRADL